MSPNISSASVLYDITDQYNQSPQDLINMPLIDIAAVPVTNTLWMDAPSAVEFAGATDPIGFHTGGVSADVSSVVGGVADVIGGVNVDGNITNDFSVSTSSASCVPSSSLTISISAGIVVLMVILFLNNIDLHGTSHDNAATVLKNYGNTAVLHVIYKYDDFIRFQTVIDERQNKMAREIAGSRDSFKTSTKGKVFVRAEFDYDSLKDSSVPGDHGLPYCAADILYVRNTTDDLMDNMP